MAAKTIIRRMGAEVRAPPYLSSRCPFPTPTPPPDLANATCCLDNADITPGRKRESPRQHSAPDFKTTRL